MPDAKDIIEKVNRKFLNTQKLRDRMDDDLSKRWLLKPHGEFVGLEGYETYKSPDSRTFARKAIATVAGAALHIRCMENNDPRETRDQDNAKEQFAIGLLKANDERLLRRPSGVPLIRAMAAHLILRGFSAGRCTFIRNEGRVYADATPWDPRQVAWEEGAFGLKWICRRYVTTRAVVMETWDVRDQDFDGDPEEDTVTVYDYYDETRNYVIVPDVRETPLKNEIHGTVDGMGLPRVPGWVQADVLVPMMQGEETSSVAGATTKNMMDAALSDFGESIFADGRATWDTHDFNMTILKNLVARTLRPVFGIRSPTGNKLVQFDPFKAGAEIPLAEGEEPIIWDFLKASQDMGPYMGVVDRERQHASFPSIMFGDAPTATSGFGMTILKSGSADKVQPAAEALQIALREITNIWADQFVTGAFGESIRLTGIGSNRKWFTANVTPDMIRDLPELEVTLTPQLPEDDAAKWQMAQIARRPGPDGKPTLSHKDVLQDIIQRQDADRDLDTIMEEMAAQNQMVFSRRMTDALANRGDMQGAAAYHIQFMLQFLQLQQMLAQGGIDINQLMASFNPETNETRAAEQGSENDGFSPDVAPNAVLGNGPPEPGVDTPFQNGGFVAPGTPRPGSQNGATNERGLGF